MSHPTPHPVVKALTSIPLQDAKDELWITKRLADLLPDGKPESAYLDSAERLDVRFRNCEGGYTSVELKYAQPYFSEKRLFDDNVGNFIKVLMTNAVHDVVNKLPRQGRPGSRDRVGFALVLYYHAAGRFSLPHDCVERFKRAAGLDRPEWQEHHCGPWTNPNISVTKCQIEVFYWERACTSDSGAKAPIAVHADLPVSMDRGTFLERAHSSLVRWAAKGQKWKWEEWVAEVLRLPRFDPLVCRVGDRIRDHEKPYRTHNYVSREQLMRVSEFLYETVREVRGA